MKISTELLNIESIMDNNIEAINKMCSFNEINVEPLHEEFLIKEEPEFIPSDSEMLCAENNTEATGSNHINNDLNEQQYHFEEIFVPEKILDSSSEGNEILLPKDEPADYIDLPMGEEYPEISKNTETKDSNAHLKELSNQLELSDSHNTFDDKVICDRYGSVTIKRIKQNENNELTKQLHLSAAEHVAELKKTQKTVTERVREHRARKKLLKYRDQQLKTLAITDMEQLRTALETKNYRNLTTRLLLPNFIDPNSVIDLQTTEVQNIGTICKRPKTAAERARRYRARKKLLKDVEKQLELANKNVLQLTQESIRNISSKNVCSNISSENYLLNAESNNDSEIYNIPTDFQINTFGKELSVNVRKLSKTSTERSQECRARKRSRINLLKHSSEFLERKKKSLNEIVKNNLRIEWKTNNEIIGKRRKTVAERVRQHRARKKLQKALENQLEPAVQNVLQPAQNPMYNMSNTNICSNSEFYMDKIEYDLLSSLHSQTENFTGTLGEYVVPNTESNKNSEIYNHLPSDLVQINAHNKELSINLAKVKRTLTEHSEESKYSKGSQMKLVQEPAKEPKFSIKTGMERSSKYLKREKDLQKEDVKNQSRIELKANIEKIFKRRRAIAESVRKYRARKKLQKALQNQQSSQEPIFNMSDENICSNPQFNVDKVNYDVSYSLHSQTENITGTLSEYMVENNIEDNKIICENNLSNTESNNNNEIYDNRLSDVQTIVHDKDLSINVTKVKNTSTKHPQKCRVRKGTQVNLLRKLVAKTDVEDCRNQSRLELEIINKRRKGAERVREHRARKKLQKALANQLEPAVKNVLQPVQKPIYKMSNANICSNPQFNMNKVQYDLLSSIHSQNENITETLGEYMVLRNTKNNRISNENYLPNTESNSNNEIYNNLPPGFVQIDAHTKELSINVTKDKRTSTEHARECRNPKEIRMNLVQKLPVPTGTEHSSEYPKSKNELQKEMVRNQSRVGSKTNIEKICKRREAVAQRVREHRARKKLKRALENQQPSQEPKFNMSNKNICSKLQFNVDEVEYDVPYSLYSQTENITGMLGEYMFENNIEGNKIIYENNLSNTESNNNNEIYDNRRSDVRTIVYDKGLPINVTKVKNTSTKHPQKCRARKGTQVNLLRKLVANTDVENCQNQSRLELEILIKRRKATEYVRQHRARKKMLKARERELAEKNTLQPSQEPIYNMSNQNICKKFSANIISIRKTSTEHNLLQSLANTGLEHSLEYLEMKKKLQTEAVEDRSRIELETNNDQKLKHDNRIFQLRITKNPFDTSESFNFYDTQDENKLDIKNQLLITSETNSIKIEEIDFDSM